MNQRKVEMREHRLSLLQAQFEARKKMLEAQGLDAKDIKKDSAMRRLQAKAKQFKRMIESIQGDAPKEEEPKQAKKAKKPAKKDAAPKAPKEKKAKPEAEAPAKKEAPAKEEAPAKAEAPAKEEAPAEEETPKD